MSAPDTSVTIIGASGALGFGLAVRLAGAGIEVTIGSRESARAEEAAHRAGLVAPTEAASGTVASMRSCPGRIAAPIWATVSW